MVLPGPADCTEEDQREENVKNVGNAEDVEAHCVAVLNGGLDDFKPLELWHAVMEKYKVAQQAREELARLDPVEHQSEIDLQKRREAEAVAEAVEGIAQLQHRDVLKKLEEFAQAQSSARKALSIAHEDEFLPTGDPLFWFKCFVRLFEYDLVHVDLISFHDSFPIIHLKKLIKLVLSISIFN